MAMGDRDRFWQNVDRSGDCWPWQGCCSGGSNHYGQVRVGGRLMLAHRRAWELAFGSIPAAMNVLHHCDNPPCCRISHLFLGSQADNVRDMCLKGRSRGYARLTDEQVREIRRRADAGERYATIASDLGICSAQYVGVLARRESRKAA